MLERRSPATWRERLEHVVLLSLAAAILVTCNDEPLPTEIVPPTFLIADAAHEGTNPDFFFLPPMVADPSGHEDFDAGGFDAGQSPVVEICQLPCEPTQPLGFPLTFDMTTEASEQVRVDETAEHFLVNWHTNQFAVEDGQTYRITVSVAETELGFADVDLYANVGQAKNANTGESIALVDGRTLPIKFRIEQGAVFVVGADGGTVTAVDGVVTLDLLAGALTGDVGLTVFPATDFPAEPGTMTGSVFAFGPDGTTFAEPVRLTISYDPGLIPLGADESAFVLGHVVDGVWTEVVGSSVDLATHTVSGLAQGFSFYGILLQPVLPPPHLSAPLVFQSSRDGDLEVYSWDGTTLRQLTNNTDIDGSPDWLGEQIVFQSNRSWNHDIWVMDQEGGSPTNLTNTPDDRDGSPKWSPDGRRIAFIRWVPSDNGYDIWGMNADGSGQANLTPDPANDANPSWSPDGTKIAFTSNREGQYEIFVMNADGSGEPTRLTFDEGTHETEPTWSPDGTRIAFAKIAPGSWGEIWIMEADGSNPHRVTVANGTRDDAPAWSPDGSQIVFQRRAVPDGQSDIWLTTPAGAGPFQIVRNAANDLEATWKKPPCPPPDVAWLSVTPAGPAVSGVGGTQQFTVEARDEDGNILPVPPVTWTSLNPYVASVDFRGLVTVRRDGQVTMQAEANGIVASAVLTASVPGAPVVNSWEYDILPGWDLHGVWSAAPNSAYAVGSDATILHFDGTNWNSMTNPDNHHLWDVWGSSDDDVYAVGAIGAILHYDGASWSRVSAYGVAEHLLAVWGSSPDNVFAVGGAGTIKHFDGVSWSSMSSGTTQTLYAVWGSSATNVYAAGANGTIVHFDGAGWSLISSPTTAQIGDVWGTSANDIFAAGGATIWHYDGASWGELPTPGTQAISDLWGVSSADVYAVGSFGTILHYDGQVWTEMASGVAQGLTAVWGTTPSDIHVVGLDGLILHYDGETWSTLSGAYDFYDVWGSSWSDIFAVGERGVVMHYDGSDWSRMATETVQDLYAVWGTSAADVFAAGGGGTVLHFDGTTWTPMSSGSTCSLRGVWGSSPTDVHAVGDDGTMLHFDGTNWYVTSPPYQDYDFRGVWGSAADNVYAVAATVYHYDGAEWSRIEDLSAVGRWYAIWGTSGSDIHVVGDTKQRRFNGTSWVDVPPPNWSLTYSVWGAANNDAYLGQGGETVAHYDGSSWSQIHQGNGGIIEGIWGSFDGDIILVGSPRLILRGRR